MYLLTNKAERAMGLPSPYGSVVLDVGESKQVTGKHFRELIKSLSTIDALEKGQIEAKHLAGTIELAPERGIKLMSVGKEMWQVLVNGFPVSDTPVDADEARRMAEEYK